MDISSRPGLLTFAFYIIELFSKHAEAHVDRCGGPRKLALPQSKEYTMHNLISLIDPMLADRRCGCRGGEVATNMQRRKIPCC